MTVGVEPGLAEGVAVGRIGDRPGHVQERLEASLEVGAEQAAVEIGQAGPLGGLGPLAFQPIDGRGGTALRRLVRVAMPGQVVGLPRECDRLGPSRLGAGRAARAATAARSASARAASTATAARAARAVACRCSQA